MVLSEGLLSDESKLVSGGAAGQPLFGAEVTSVGKGGGAVPLEEAAGGEAAFVVGVIEDGGVNGGEFLQAPHPPKAECRAHALSK